jgi:hypothetical protein
VRRITATSTGNTSIRRILASSLSAETPGLGKPD